MQTTLTIFAVAMALWLAFLTGAGKAAGLESAAESRAAPVTIVILPPDVKAEDAETRVAAELLCDRLAEGLGDIAGIRVVDRTQIDRVLAEHTLASKPAGPVLAYDAMVRVSVDALAPLPRVRLSVIDLSHGNVIGPTEQHWHMEMSPEALSEMVEACAVAAKALAAEPDGRLTSKQKGARTGSANRSLTDRETGGPPHGQTVRVESGDLLDAGCTLKDLPGTFNGRPGDVGGTDRGAEAA